MELEGLKEVGEVRVGDRYEIYGVMDDRRDFILIIGNYKVISVV